MWCTWISDTSVYVNDENQDNSCNSVTPLYTEHGRQTDEGLKEKCTVGTLKMVSCFVRSENLRCCFVAIKRNLVFDGLKNNLFQVLSGEYVGGK